MFIVFSIKFCLVFSTKCKPVSIDRNDSEEVPSIPRALIKRLTNLTVEYDFWRLQRVVFISLAVAISFNIGFKANIEFQYVDRSISEH